MNAPWSLPLHHRIQLLFRFSAEKEELLKIHLHHYIIIVLFLNKEERLLKIHLHHYSIIVPFLTEKRDR